ncbi:MAG TPA: 7-carboxy-7-deazaguanine synthase QueE [Candidatus Omnitrophota bacterium]|nr:7-carboxy-7-deazaguanine synthase QueE [Candidatus Omnitrophota bacterium]
MIHPPTSEKARITEIFSSIQGEGLRMGERHLFIRFEECHMACDYCDEHDKSGKEMTPDEILHELDRLEDEKGPHAFVSLTGGEPLLYTSFLKPLCYKLKEKKYKILLETNGILWQALEGIVNDCDLIAMDLKLSSVSRDKDYLEEHRKFLKIAWQKEAYIKVVVSEEIDQQEFERHLRMVAAVASKAPVFLQPASKGKEAYEDTELIKLLNDLQRLGSQWLPDVRLGIQLHKIFNVR